MGMDWIEEKNSEEQCAFLQWFLNWCKKQKDNPKIIETYIEGDLYMGCIAKITVVISPLFVNNGVSEILFIDDKTSHGTDMIDEYVSYFADYLKINNEEAVSFISFFYILFQDWTNRDDVKYSYIKCLEKSNNKKHIITLNEFWEFCMHVIDIYWDGQYKNDINYLIRKFISVYLDLPRHIEVQLNIIPPSWYD